jgi:hypothetical protein
MPDLWAALVLLMKKLFLLTIVLVAFGLAPFSICQRQAFIEQRHAYELERAAEQAPGSG